MKIRARRIGQFAGVLAAQPGEEAAGVGDEGGLAGLAAMGHRGEEGGVGFDEEPVERQARGGFLEVAGVLEGDDARDRDIEAEIERDVGELAAGWNAGVQKFGVKLPAWVARHGSKRSSAAVLNTFRFFRIILTNAVKYVTNVDAYDRRIQSAINIQGRKMQRRAEFLLTRALRQAGWK